MIINCVIQAALWIFALGCIITYLAGKRMRAESRGIKIGEVLMLCLYSGALLYYYLAKPAGKKVLLVVLIGWFLLQVFWYWKKKSTPLFLLILRHLLIALAGLFLVLFGFWDMTQPRYQYTLSGVHEAAGRQGVCAEDGYYWVSGSATLTKYDSDWNVVAENNEPLKGYKWKVNHIGDIDVYQNDLFLGVELFVEGEASNIQVAIYDGDTLEKKWVFPLHAETGQIECSGIAIDPDSDTVYLSAWGNDEAGSCLYMYDLTSGDFKGTLEMEPAPKWIQGVTCHDGQLYITCDDGDAESGEPDSLYRLDVDEDRSKATVVFEYALTDVTEQGEIEGLNVDKESGQMLILYNRGAIIRDGHIAGFREGYTEEVHEVFVYERKDRFR